MKNKIKSGVFWVFITQAWTQILQTATGLILAAILLPEDFGLVAMAGIIIGWLGLIKNLGFDAALIYENDENGEKANAAFWILQLTGVSLWALAILAAEPASIFFNEPRVKYLIIVTGASFPLTSLKMVHGALLQKELEIKKSNLASSGSILVTTITTILLALAGLRYWSLVIGSLTGGVVLGITYWRLCPFRPQLPIKWKEAAGLWRFGSIAAITNILVIANQMSDNLFVGKMLGTTKLGFYDFAYRMGNAPGSRITMPIYQIAYPAFIKAKEQSLEKLRQTYLNTIKYLCYLVIPMAVAIVVIGPFFFNLLYGSRWDPAMRAMRVLVIYGLVAALAGPVGTLFYALGKPQNLLYIDLSKFITVLAFVYFAVKWGGILGVAILYTFASLIFSLIAVLWGNRLITINNINYFNVYKNPIIASTLIGAIVWIWLRADSGMGGWWSWCKIALALLFSIISYIGMLLLLDQNIRNIWGKFKKGFNKEILTELLNG